MRIAALTFLLFSSVYSSAQNLLANGGFEDINVCTEYVVECAPEAWISSTNSFNNFFKDKRRAHGGMNCMAIEAGNFVRPYQRTFIRSRLLCGLRKGSTYKLRFFIKSFHDVFDSLGVWFSDRDPLFDKRTLPQITPSVYLEKFVHPLNISDSSWHFLEISYTATGEERFIAIGNFAKDDYVGERSHPLENRYFVFFDDLEMVPTDTHEYLCANWQETKDDIYDENERHKLLEQKIRRYKINPPPPPTIVRNTLIIIDTIILPDILFATGKADLQSQSHKILDGISDRIRNAKIDSIVLEGHTDTVGSYTMNEKLSYDRAFSVKTYLQAKTGYENFITRGWAFLKPVADNKTPQGRQRNRRVEVFLYIRE